MIKSPYRILVVCLLALWSSACAPREPIPPKLITNATDSASSDAKNETSDAKGRHHSKDKDKNLPLGATLEYETAVNDCDDQATKETTGSVLTILTRLRPGAYTAKYVACMKKKGYDVSH
jgi:hypothetical protein